MDRFELANFNLNLLQMLSTLDSAGRAAAWQEVGRSLAEFEREGAFVGPCELIVAVGTKPWGVKRGRNRMPGVERMTSFSAKGLLFRRCP